jgi:hypothetical protein
MKPKVKAHKEIEFIVTVTCVIAVLNPAMTTI